MKSENLIPKDYRKPIYVARYIPSGKPEEATYLFIYSAYNSLCRQQVYSCYKEKDPCTAALSLRQKFSEGVKFGLASKFILEQFIDSHHIEQLALGEFFELRSSLEAA